MSGLEDLSPKFGLSSNSVRDQQLVIPVSQTAGNVSDIESLAPRFALPSNSILDQQLVNPVSRSIKNSCPDSATFELYSPDELDKASVVSKHSVAHAFSQCSPVVERVKLPSYITHQGQLYSICGNSVDNFSTAKARHDDSPQLPTSQLQTNPYQTKSYPITVEIFLCMTTLGTLQMLFWPQKCLLPNLLCLMVKQSSTAIGTNHLLGM